MTEEKLLTVREVARALNLSEKDVLDMAENGTIPAYKVGGVYLRFKHAQVKEYQKRIHATSKAPQEISFNERIYDFFYYNDFYIFSILLMILMMFIIFK